MFVNVGNSLSQISNNQQLITFSKIKTPQMLVLVVPLDPPMIFTHMKKHVVDFLLKPIMTSCGG